MRPFRLCLTLAIPMAWAMSFLVPAACAQPTAAAVSTPKKVAKAPEAAPARPAAVAPTKATTPAKPLKLAQLEYPVPPTASAAELMQAADDFATYADWGRRGEPTDLHQGWDDVHVYLQHQRQ